MGENFKTEIIALAILLVVSSCNSKEMNFEISEQRELVGIASASGIEVTGEDIYVVGDNTPWLFKLNRKMELVEKIQLFPQKSFSDSIIEKLQKPDLEALTSVDKVGEKLYAFGSGSKSPERDILVEINLILSASGETSEYSLADFYQSLRKQANLTPAEFNIEAAVIFDDFIFLFNRGKNVIFKFSLPEFQNYLFEDRDIPEAEIFKIHLPEINGIISGFSGATIDREKEMILFTSTVEDTDNWIDDGEILGSFIGVIKLEDLVDQLTPQSFAIVRDETYLRIKVESIAVFSESAKDKLDLILVTDSDGGKSEFVRGVLTL